MPDIYKPLLNIAGDWLTTLTRRRLHQKHYAAKVQQKTLPKLLAPLAKTKRGKKLGITAEMTPEAFRQTVLISDHAGLAPWLEHVKAGKANLLWPGKCECFAATAGTTTGSPRLVPVTSAMQSAYSAGSRDAILHATARAGGVHALLGRVLLLGGSVPTNQLSEDAPFFAADLATLAAVQHPEWIARHYFEPSSRIALREDWDAMVERILKSTRKKNVSMIVGNPHWILAFARHVTRSLSKDKFRFTSLQSIWPGLQCVTVTGGFSMAVMGQLREVAGEGVMIHEVFATAEAVIAAQGPGALPGLRLLADTGVYFEFLPVTDYDAQPISEIGPKALPVNRVQTGIDYLVIVTTPAGLVRHITGDVVQFTSVNPPRLLPMGQIDLRLHQFGENLLTRTLVDVLSSVCRANQWNLSFFHVAPLTDHAELGSSHGQHEWWIELQPGTIETPTGPNIAAELDSRLQEIHETYKLRRKEGRLKAPYVRLVMPGAFEHWMRHNSLWGGPHKLPIARNDRQIADGLTKMARFSKD
ncbi:MAG: GH3 auxin-responsive promoter family protein [Synoicihabitans sp.]